MATCMACRGEITADGRCACPALLPPPWPPRRLVSDALDLESVDEDGPADEALWWLGEEELPF